MSEGVTGLVAVGCNIHVVCRIFQSPEKGLEWCEKTFGEQRFLRKLPKALPGSNEEATELGSWSDGLDLMYSEERKVFMKGLFTDYYGGCGEVELLELRILPFDAPFVKWDLD